MTYTNTIKWMYNQAPSGSGEAADRWVSHSLAAMRHWDALEEHLEAIRKRYA